MNDDTSIPSGSNFRVYFSLCVSVEERRLRQDIQNKLLQDIETETETFRSEQSMFYKSKADGISSDMDAMEKENKKVIQRY